MAERGYLVVDCGASNGRAIVARFDGKRFALQEAHRFDNRPVTAAGTLYWDLLRLFSEIEAGIQKGQRLFPGLSAMGVDTWGVDFGLLDSRGKLLANPVHYRDSRRNSLSEEACGIVPRRELFRLSGASILSIVSLFNLYALQKDRAPELESARRFLMMPDLLHYFLTGEAANELSDACTTAAFNQVERRWDERILDPLGIPRGIFSTPVAPGTRLGPVLPAICSELGIRTLDVIAPATHDTASAVTGVPARETDPPWAFISIGTWGVVGMETDRPVLDDAVFEAGWGNEGGGDGGSFLAVNVAGLWLAQQCRQKWMRDRGVDIGWEEIVRAALEAPALSTLVDVDDPVFAPVGPDEPQVIAQYCRTRGLRPPQGMGAVARCIYESLALKFRVRLRELQSLTGKRIELVRMVGGGTQNASLCQWTADATGVPVEAGPAEATVAGNLVLQLKGSGEVSSVGEGRAVVAASFPTRRFQPGDKAAWEDAAGRFLAQVHRDAVAN
jgi:sugar (pentulose or hexulose) kinase